jgi:PAS domain S-box-containing protein
MLFHNNKMTQDQAQPARTELRHAFDLIPTLAWSTSRSGAFEFANKRWHDYTGMSQEAAAAGQWILTFHPDDIEKVSQKWTELLSSGICGEVEARICRHDGVIRRFLVRATPVYDDDHIIVRWYGTNTDIDDLNRSKEVQEALARSGRLIAMGELTASIAHEVNQPLMALGMNAATCLQCLNESQLNIPEARRAAERVIRDGHRAADVISSIRAMARKSPMQIKKLDLNDVVMEVLTFAYGELNRGGIDVQTFLAANGEFVLGDRVQVQQVILNLLLNGIEAMTAIDDRSRILQISSRSDDCRFIIVTIADSGIGLGSESIDKIFEGSFTTKSEGIGMGLSICRSIVETHGGRLWATPRLPYGTAFHFTIPIYVEDFDEGKADQ